MIGQEPASVQLDDVSILTTTVHEIESNKTDSIWRRPAVVAFILVLLASSAASLFILQQILDHSAYPYDIDEANHANGALAMLLGFNADGLGGLLQAFFRRGFYPPAFSLAQILAAATLGLSVTALRTCSVLAFFGSILLIYVICLRIDRRYGWLAGLIACGATLTSQPLLINSALVMKETPGLLVSVLFLWLYLRTFKRPTPRWLAISGLALLLVFLTKYTYGVVVAATVIFMELSLLRWPAGSARPAPRCSHLLTQVRRRYLWLFAPFLLGVAIWFAYPGNLGLFFDYVTAQPEGVFTWTVERFLFYPRSIVQSQTPAPIFAVLTALSLLWAALRWRDASTRLLLIYFVAGMAIMILNKTQNPRFIATFVPAAHVLTGLMVAHVAGIRSTLRPLPPITRLAALGLVAIVSLSLPNVAQRFRSYPDNVAVAYETDPQLQELALWIQSQIPLGERFYVINYWDQFAPQTLAWRLGKRALEADEALRFREVLMPSALLKPATPEHVQQLRNQLLRTNVAYVVVFEGGPWGAPFWPEYTFGLQENLEHTAETEMTVTHPVAPGESNEPTIKAIVYRWRE